MTERKKRLISRALETHRSIAPCSNRTELSECFSQQEDKLILWFNTEDNSTHILVEEVAG